MTIRGRLVIAAMAVGLMACSQNRSDAAFITYTETATASGSLGGVAFNDVLVTLSATADTTNIVAAPLFFSVTPTTATVTVAGLGSAAFTSKTFDVFDNQTFITGGITGMAGFGDSAEGTLLGDSNAAFASYALATPIGPLTGSGFASGTLASFATTGGDFVIAFATSPAIFTATTVPEPSSLALCGFAGAMGVGISWRRRQRRQAA
jgi:hypothetical protein